MSKLQQPDPAPRPYLADGLGFAEGPRWRDGRLYFSDVGVGRVYSASMSGQLDIVAEIDGHPSGLGWLPDGRLLIVSMLDSRVLRVEADGSVVEHADLTGLVATTCNDMTVDARGNAYVGGPGIDLSNRPSVIPPAELVLVRPDGSAEVVDREVIFPNGALMTPDGGTLIVAETFGRRLTAFTVGPDGRLSDRRCWADLPGCAPDGIAIDSEGAVWVADTYGHVCVRVREGGQIDRIVETERRVFACALGGPDLKTLFLLTAEEFSEVAFARRTGSIEMVTVEVPGVAAPWSVSAENRIDGGA